MTRPHALTFEEAAQRGLAPGDLYTVETERGDTVQVPSSMTHHKGRPHLAITSEEFRYDFDAFVAVPCTHHLHQIALTMLDERSSFGIHFAEPHIVPSDHASIVGYFHQRISPKFVCRSLRPRLGRTFSSGFKVKQRRWTPFQEGAIVLVSLGPLPEDTIPGVVLTAPWAQTEHSSFHRVSVVLTVRHEDFDEDPGCERWVEIIRKGECGLAEDRTALLYLIHTFDGVRLTPCADEHGTPAVMSAKRFQGLRARVDSLIWGRYVAN